jgi:hypothetical protein
MKKTTETTTIAWTDPSLSIPLLRAQPKSFSSKIPGKTPPAPRDSKNDIQLVICWFNGHFRCGHGRFSTE